MKRIAFLRLLGLLLLTCQHLTAQVTLRVVSLPATTPPGAQIFFAGSINNWNPADNNYILTPDANGVPQIVIPQGTGTVQFKFTRGGSWTTVEGGPNGEEIANRSFTFTGGPQTINLTIQSWKDLVGSTAASNVQILNPSFFMPQLNRSRRVWLYLPPDYATSSKRYPVLYMHDGQNLFDTRTSFSGEWGVDETLNTLQAGGDYGAIVVGIDNGGASRLNEYSPWVNSQYGGGEGAAYIDFIANTLKPHIDANYRTLTGPEHTALFGSSMGALISTYGAVRYPQIFGKVGSFSPAYWFALSDLNSYINATTTPLAGIRIYHLAGQNESSTMVPNINSITSSLRSKGVTVPNSTSKVDADGAHSEWYWRREFGAAYQWLFANATTSVRNVPRPQLLYKVVPNPVQQVLQLEGYRPRPGDVVQIVSVQGSVLRTWVMTTTAPLPVGDLAPGLYLLLLNRQPAGRFVKQ
ncbi:MAG TPA: alpha/beta hydrolase-fold protein [Lacibacter sp.]|nr:alpha/beta hydrolase-fold protein [Lacibacter sp.]HMO90211.1 alpha/beta hydrolase-fold protein [Lacibacter sp.]